MDGRTSEATGGEEGHGGIGSFGSRQGVMAQVTVQCRILWFFGIWKFGWLLTSALADKLIGM